MSGCIQCKRSVLWHKYSVILRPSSVVSQKRKKGKLKSIKNGVAKAAAHCFVAVTI